MMCFWQSGSGKDGKVGKGGKVGCTRKLPNVSQFYFPVFTSYTESSTFRKTLSGTAPSSRPPSM